MRTLTTQATPSEILHHIAHNCISEECAKKMTYIILGKPGCTGKTWLTTELTKRGFKAYEISEGVAGIFDYNDEKNHFIEDPYGRYVTIVLNKPYERREGCETHTTQANAVGKNLTKVIKHPYLERESAVYERDDKKWGEHIITKTPGDGPEYLAGPVVDRLHEFEKLGYEPEDLKRIIERRREMNIWYSYSRDAFDALYYAYKKAGDIENSLRDDICSMYPSTLLSPSGFISEYVKKEEFRKLVIKRIKRVMEKMPSLRDAVDTKIIEEIMKPFDVNRPVNYQKIWVTTSSSVKDDELTKKLKEVAEELKKGFKDGLECPKKNLWLDFKRQFISGFNYVDTDAIRGGFNRTLTDEEIAYIKYDTYMAKKALDAMHNKKEKAMTITKNPEYAFKIKRVLFNNPATIVFWADGDKTVVKCQNGEPYDPEKGLAMAISKKALGNDRDYYHVFKKWMKKCESTEPVVIKKLCVEVNPKIQIAAWHGYHRLLNALHDKKATKADLIAAMEEAVGCFGEELE